MYFADTAAPPTGRDLNLDGQDECAVLMVVVRANADERCVIALKSPDETRLHDWLRLVRRNLLQRGPARSRFYESAQATWVL